MAPFAFTAAGDDAANRATLPASKSSPFTPKQGPRARVMVVNDLSGDIDGLFATVHALLSPSAEVRGIVGTAALGVSETPQRSIENAAEILRLMGLTGKVPLHVGAPRRMTDSRTAIDCPGARAIIEEAMRDSKVPLYITVGGGLTELASALLLEPRIADRFTLVWIGGKPHDEGGPEYNFLLDRKAAQFVFNSSTVPLFQVTSKGYGTCQVSNSELQAHVAPYGAIGAWLYGRLEAAAASMSWNAGETWTLGDSPLVLLTALTSWVPSGPGRYDGTSSPFVETFAPRLHDDGSYERRSEGRKIRVFDGVDTRLMFGDFFSKMRQHYG